MITLILIQILKDQGGHILGIIIQLFITNGHWVKTPVQLIQIAFNIASTDVDTDGQYISAWARIYRSDIWWYQDISVTMELWVGIRIGCTGVKTGNMGNANYSNMFGWYLLDEPYNSELT